MVVSRDFWVGFAVGVVTGAVGYRLYEQNSGQLQQLIQPALGSFGAATAPGGSNEPSVEELLAQKERLEDLIAEKKLEA